MKADVHASTNGDGAYLEVKGYTPGGPRKRWHQHPRKNDPSGLRDLC